MFLFVVVVAKDVWGLYFMIFMICNYVLCFDVFISVRGCKDVLSLYFMVFMICIYFLCLMFLFCVFMFLFLFVVAKGFARCFVIPLKYN